MNDPPKRVYLNKFDLGVNKLKSRGKYSLTKQVAKCNQNIANKLPKNIVFEEL